MLAVLGLLAAVVAVLVRAIAVPWQPWVVLAAFAHYPMWAAPVALGLALLVRRRATALLAALATVLVLVVQVPPLVDSQPGSLAAAHGRRLVVLQANLRLGNADPAALVRLVRTRHVAVLATEELTFAEQRHLLAAGLGALLPHHFTAPLPSGGGGLGMWCRYPITDEHNLPRFTLGVLTARLAVPGGAPVRFAAVHLLPPYPYHDRTWLREIASLRGVLSRLRDTPTFVAGDFNATTDNAQFRRLLTGGYADAAQASGSGYLPSYPADRWFPPVIGIDHVLVRGAFVATVHTVALPNSDHRGLLVAARV